LGLLREALRQNSDVNAVTEDGWSALHFAAFRGHKNIVQALLDSKINPNIQGKLYGRTALHYAVDQEKTEIVRLILSYNPDVTLRDKSRSAPIVIAKKKILQQLPK